MLEWPVAFRASRGEASHHVLVDPCANIIEPPTIQTRHLSCRAVDLLNLPATGQMMKPVDILGDQAFNPPCSSHRARISCPTFGCASANSRAAKLFCLQYSTPPPRCHKIVEQHRL
ncbi:MAG: hypothetical protein CM1200mP2_44320 [Planctomycetaceae bacterium]|nr:MAG: hypothetical protein CM1200mP2_44320 [Planctomycetaceae bacterium]